MSTSDTTTSWNLIRGAAAGDPEARTRFAESYAPLIRRYLRRRWRVSPLISDVEDALQEAFLECLREDGVLQSVESDHAGGFRAFLYGAVRKVALRFEERRRRDRVRTVEEIAEDARVGDSSVAATMDRDWAYAILREAARRMAEGARGRDEDAQRRIELLRLRFQGGLAIRELAARWDLDRDFLHLEYAKARREFKAALRDVLYPGARVPDDLLEREVMELSRLLGRR